MRSSPRAIIKFPGGSRWVSVHHDNLRFYVQVDWEGLDSRKINIKGFKLLSLTFFEKWIYMYMMYVIYIYI